MLGMDTWMWRSGTEHLRMRHAHWHGWDCGTCLFLKDNLYCGHPNKASKRSTYPSRNTYPITNACFSNLCNKKWALHKKCKKLKCWKSCAKHRHFKLQPYFSHDSISFKNICKTQRENWSDKSTTFLMLHEFIHLFLKKFEGKNAHVASTT